MKSLVQTVNMKIKSNYMFYNMMKSARVDFLKKESRL